MNETLFAAIVGGICMALLLFTLGWSNAIACAACIFWLTVLLKD